MLVMADEIENCGKIFDWAFYCSMAFLLALAALYLCFMVEAVFKLSRVTKCLQHVILVSNLGLSFAKGVGVKVREA
jgi:hypothetical protein